LESDRLVLRRITPDDLPFFARLPIPGETNHLHLTGSARAAPLCDATLQPSRCSWS
jgi:hypothetical protein